MKTTYTLLCLTCAFLLILGFQAFYPSSIPVNKEKELLAKANDFNLRFPQEKIYLHLDRPSYWSNDDIWFKAYLKDSPIPDCNLYVELLNSAGTVIQKKMCWAQNGLAYGDLHLKDTLSTGVYQIRAYTNWMRNFNDFWFFRKDFVIWNLNDKVIRHESISLKENDIDFQFFPEGGSFVTNLLNKVAFKATDQNGKGLDVQGRIIDNDQNEIIDFKSQYKGMGSFMIQPQAGVKYKALVTIARDIQMEVDLPTPQPNGVAIALYTKPKDKLLIQVSETAAADDTLSVKKYLLVGQSRGEVLFNQEISLKNGIATLQIDNTSLPTGVMQVTLFDNELIPCCERLVFINHHDFINVEIKPERTKYTTREKVQIGISTFDQGVPCFSNLSIAVCNSNNYMQVENYSNNILTHFLLTSDLKGNIETPAYYFKDDSLTTLLALDNLMLTHGWRQFEWKEILADQFPKINYQPEGGIKVKGTVKTLLAKKPVANEKVNLLFMRKGLSFNQVISDSSGYFEFPDLYFNDTVAVTIQAATDKGKKSTSIEIDKRSFHSPEAKFPPLNYTYLNDRKVNTTNYFADENIQNINRKWHLRDTIMLPEVRVVKTKQKKGVRPLRLYEKADFVLDMDTDDDELGNVMHKLEDKFHDVLVRVFDEDNSIIVNIDYQGAPPALVLDGLVLKDGLVPGDAYQLIKSIPAGAFDKIEVLKNGAVYGSIGGGAICFFTKKGAFARTPKSIGMKSTRIIGYSLIRKFYSPNYETKLPQDIKDDFRNTLYWNPIVRTDSTGVANVSFYNSDQTGEVQVVVEGITSDGKLCRGLCKYNVTK